MATYWLSRTGGWTRSATDCSTRTARSSSSAARISPCSLFLDHPQQILDRDTIANATRGREVLPLERIVDMAVSRLRQRLRDTGKAPRLIQTVRGSGYLLAAQVRPHLQP